MKDMTKTKKVQIQDVLFCLFTKPCPTRKKKKESQNVALFIVKE
jgi:hypothetical protein